MLYVPKCNCPTKHQEGKSTDKRRALNDLKSRQICVCVVGEEGEFLGGEGEPRQVT